MMSDMTRSAVISECGKYRYRLTRAWEDGPRVCFFMMNPSTADGLKDDATIRKCIGFAKTWGYPGIEVVNLSAWRATNPKELHTVADLSGLEYYYHIEEALHQCDMVVLAWGCEKHLKPAGLLQRAEEVLSVNDFRATFPNKSIKCLGKTKGGTPRHPLMLPYKTPLEDI